ncbi:MAG: NifU family protein [Mycoplasma sp.]
MEKDIRESIIEMIESLRIYVNQDGGDLEFVDYVDGYVQIKVLGACVGCDLLDVTYKDGIESIIMEEFPEVKGLKIINL